MKHLILIIAGLGLFLLSNQFALAGEGHDHSSNEETHNKKPESKKKKENTKEHQHNNEENDHHEDEANGHSEHGDHKGHNEHKEGDDHKSKSEGDSHDHGEEPEHSAKNVGSEKGITSLEEEVGFTMSAEAIKTFSVEEVSITGAGPWTVPESALLITGEEKSVYRVRNKTFKRVEVVVDRKGNSQVVIRSGELQSGDSLVVKGVGEIRVAELDATSGESGHSH